ncbi:origin recognition complex subunit 1, putative [Plasmodium knowlesi strain H]|uniref:Origin recognition complex subunit 1 n=3 Tax=Plasmodium knowlesi TaxID=5850 RepID=A0A5K1VAS8_PLAKH|nr:origin recognition complex subunit 1, putative [Plasmodium knowlesi strain H]OTN66661.1 putative Origin recognition complex 1 protein [Plasmodium knowlesi]CAA9990069.1 origin recognition complex subunit 1, putative [Plasmodium knowlesi strain H]SBO25731.1 origin recognition complex subunit 1, putative [Plasmodium knowlesi strain H]SBO28541.1 origin recognition complex subunit 1, putative [Plasmodium knowlesi strain H]VVS79543.1 origin recognition complex subunit 1, putative [Plasmodium know|eukprot:XP_002260536.1 Origin recognition complex 1 protein, putative [Plasmodium knowlesi strain H]
MTPNKKKHKNYESHKSFQRREDHERHHFRKVHNFHLNDNEILSPTKGGIKLDVNKLSIESFPRTPRKEEQKKKERLLPKYDQIQNNTVDFYIPLNERSETPKKNQTTVTTTIKTNNQKKHSFDSSSSSFFSSPYSTYSCISESSSSVHSPSVVHEPQVTHVIISSDTSPREVERGSKILNKQTGVTHTQSYDRMRRSPRNHSTGKYSTSKSSTSKSSTDKNNYDEDAEGSKQKKRNTEKTKVDHSNDDVRILRSVTKENSLRSKGEQKKDEKRVVSGTRSSVLLKRKSQCLWKDSYVYQNFFKKAKTGVPSQARHSHNGSSTSDEDDDSESTGLGSSRPSTRSSSSPQKKRQTIKDTLTHKQIQRETPTHAQKKNAPLRHAATINKRSSMLPVNEERGGIKKESTEELKEFTIEEVAKLTKDTCIKLVENNSCQYEDGVIYESLFINQVEYTIGDDVLLVCTGGGEFNAGTSGINTTNQSSKNKNKQRNGYQLRKGKISSFYKNQATNQVEAEVCIYIDQHDAPYIKHLCEKQKSRRAKADFEVFLDDETKNFYLLGNINFKILNAKMILKKINVYNEKSLYDEDKTRKQGKDKFLCTQYLKEREERICEIQNSEHWDNLVLGSSDLYYSFSNNKKSSKNKSLKLIIEKMKENEGGGTKNKSHKSKIGPSNTATSSAKKDQSRNKTNGSTPKQSSQKNPKVDIKDFIKQDQENYYVNLLRNITDPTDKAIRMMQLDVVPKYLPCREKEIKEVHAFLESGIKQSGSNQILYISGMPGTGKTATVYSVIQLLQHKTKQKLLPNFNVFEINGMNVVHPNAAYQVLYKQMFNKKPPNALNSFKMLDRLFNQNKKDTRNVSILIIDEIDYLITKTQKVLFTLFDWPTKINSKLVLIAISNTMDLPERLIPRCRSRLAFGRLVFSPYKGDEIEKIIKERLENCKEIIDHTAIQLCARKVANVSGDIRKALQICRKAFENRRGQKIVPRDITEATNQLFDSPLTNAINYLPWPFKMFLTCIIVELRMLNDFIIPYKKVLNRYKVLVETSGKYIGMCSNTELFKIMLDKLVKMGILLIRPYIPLESLAKNKNKEMLLGFNESSKKNASEGTKSSRTQVSAEIDKESGDMGLELNVETQLIITALMKDAECSQKLNFY